MATATVFVDDAVLGHLPGVCVRTGTGTDDIMRLTTAVGGHEGIGLAWILVLFGPLGWLGLFLYAATRRAETITVRLPYCEPAYEAFEQDRRAKRIAGVATLVLVAGALAGIFTSTLPGRVAATMLLLVAAGAATSYLANALRLRRYLPRVSLDGSRRWVTLTGCSAEFADAVNSAHQAKRAVAAPASRPSPQ
jgi:hypothetical protein